MQDSGRRGPNVFEFLSSLERRFMRDEFPLCAKTAA